MVSTKKQSKRDLEPNPSFIMHTFAWGWIVCLLLIAGFNNGIFQGYGIHNPSSYQFEKPILYSMLVAFFIVCWCVIHIVQKYTTWKTNAALGVAGLVIPLVYLLATFQAGSPYLAKYGLFVSIMLFVFFIAGILLANYKSILQWFPTVYLIFGYFVVFYGFLTLFGNAYMLDSLTPQDGVRITSVFQYPNAYAVLLLTLWIAILIEINRTSSRFAQLLHGFMLMPVIVSFFLTLSRGALVILPVIAVAALAMFTLRQQIMAILYSIIGVGLSLAIYTALTERGIAVITGIQEAAANQMAFDTVAMFSGETIGYWGLLIGVSVVMSAATFALAKYVEPKVTKMTERFGSRWANATLPLAFIGVFVVGAAAIFSGLLTRFLPPIIRERVEGVNFQTHSVYERLTMYKDALSIWKQNPIFGAGTGTWESFYERYQSYPYSSMQTHSYFVQLLAETGIVGFIAIVGLIAAVLVVFLRSYRKAEEEERSVTLFYFMTPVTILLHSLIDFGMSYLLYGFIVFLCLGILAGTQRNVIFSNVTEAKRRIVQYSTAAALGALSIAVVVFAAKWLYASDQFDKYTQAVNTNQTYETMMSHLDSSLKQNPGHPIVLNQAVAINYQVYEQTQDPTYLDVAKQYLDKLVAKEPNYQAGMYMNYLVHEKAGDDKAALQIILDGIASNKYEQGYYEQAVSVLLRQWEEQRQSGSDSKAVEDKIIELHDEMVRLRAGVDELPETVIVSRPFNVPNSVRVAAGQVYYVNGDYAKAEEVLQPGIMEDLSQPNDRYAARYYLASLRKQGKDDPALYERLIQADPEEANVLGQLLQ